MVSIKVKAGSLHKTTFMKDCLTEVKKTVTAKNSILKQEYASQEYSKMAS